MTTRLTKAVTRIVTTPRGGTFAVTLAADGIHLRSPKAATVADRRFTVVLPYEHAYLAAARIAADHARAEQQLRRAERRRA